MLVINSNYYWVCDQMTRNERTVPVRPSEIQEEGQLFQQREMQDQAWVLSQPLELREQVWGIWVPPMMLLQ